MTVTHDCASVGGTITLLSMYYSSYVVTMISKSSPQSQHRADIMKVVAAAKPVKGGAVGPPSAEEPPAIVCTRIVRRGGVADPSLSSR